MLLLSDMLIIDTIQRFYLLLVLYTMVLLVDYFKSNFMINLFYYVSEF